MTMRSWLSQSGRVVRCDEADGATEPMRLLGRTTDGGKTWQVFNSPTIIELRFTDPVRGWALATTGPSFSYVLLRTTDGGAHWQRVQIP